MYIFLRVRSWFIYQGLCVVFNQGYFRDYRVGQWELVGEFRVLGLGIYYINSLVIKDLKLGQGQGWLKEVLLRYCLDWEIQVQGGRGFVQGYLVN